ncbi:MAG: aminotransferase class I/II-fold pyridoxal phosphate-dependent enzyme [Bacteroidales bacterium]|nr:aminotransferase class I/II-fold pyridoxal phosphate-dependent enzyme [Bacteroidales bacterium]
MVDSAKRTEQVREYYFSGKLSVIREMISSGIDVINMGVGSPDILPPGEVIEALTSSCINPEAHGYQPYRGIDELRSAISDWYYLYYKVKTNPASQVLPLIGSKEGIMHISMAYLNSGDAVLVPDTGYPAYATAARICGARCIYYDLNDENNWMPDLESLENENLQEIKLMWVNYPNMPAGVKATAGLFRALVNFARRHNILVVNDNPYSFILNNRPLSILSGNSSFENVLELNSLSKSHNMAGWRLGMVIGHEKHINDILKIKSNIDSGMFLPIQQAAIKAFRMGQEWYDKLNSIYLLRQQMVYDLLNYLDCSTRADQSGLFLWSRIPDEFADSYEFSEHCLDKYHLFIAPGLVFGLNGSRYVRTSLCLNESRIKEAIGRVKK